MKYIPFNVKTDYSLLESLIKVDDFFNFCEREKVKYTAICDSNLSGCIDFYNKTKKLGIKLAIGLEIIINDISLYLYAKNYEGYKNLLKINTLKEKNELSALNIKNFSDNIICVIDYENYNFVKSNDLFSCIFIGYQNQFEKTNALILSDLILFNRKIKVLHREDSIYLKYLNELGGLNNLSKNFCLESIDDEKEKEYQTFFELINLSFPKTEKHIPVYSSNDNERLYKLAVAGLSKRLKGITNSVYSNRLNYELDVIKQMGFTSYFLIVYDYVLYAKKNNILVGPGRGSAAGSLVCYSIGITDIDPIKYDLLFERFLNKDRVSMPDIDIDFDSEKREDIISYVRDKYGDECVAVGSTYNTLKTKLVLREVGKIKKIDNYLFEKFLKIINRNVSLAENLKNEKILKYLKTYNELNEIYKISLKLENIKKNISTHAAGVVICDQEIDNIIPIYYNDGKYKTGVPMDFLENLGILKMDFLGLKNLTVISNIISDKNINLNSINLDDKKVLDIFKSANTDGIFQYETFAMKELLKKLNPKNFDELVAAVALVRPGPNEFLAEYIKGKDKPDEIVYFKNLEPVLKNTYGIVLYQEQIIKILNIVGGFSSSEADIIRRAISKKKTGIIEKSKDKFINNAVALGYDKNEATSLFLKIEKFAGYGFNKSHSVAYALIGYQMAYLKVYYESEFINELLKNSKDNKVIENYIREIKNKKIKVLKPEINFSKNEFCMVNESLMLPLNLIKGVGFEVENQILSNAPYDDFFQFCLLNKNIDKKILENIISSGAMRSFKYNIKTLLNNLDNAYIYSELGGYGQKPVMEECEEFSLNELSLLEYDMYGFYISNHPASKYNDKKLMKLIDKNNNLFKNITMVVKIENKKEIKTKTGKDMAFLLVSDETGKDDVVVFNDVFEKIKNINKNDLVKICGKINKNQDKVNIVLGNIEKLEV